MPTRTSRLTGAGPQPVRGGEMFRTSGTWLRCLGSNQGISRVRTWRVCQRPPHPIGALRPPDVVTGAGFEPAHSPLLGRDLCRDWATQSCHVRRQGVEPRTVGLRIHYSAIELAARIVLRADDGIRTRIS